jgi:hypothetical protein
MAIGANVSGYAIPGVLRQDYGDRPFGATVFLRFRLAE